FPGQNLTPIFSLIAAKEKNMEISAVSLLQRCLKTQEAADKVAFYFTEERIHEIQGKKQSTKGVGWFHRDGDRLKYTATNTEEPGKVSHFVEVFTSDLLVRYQWMPPEKGPTMGGISKVSRMQAFVERCGELDGYDTIIRPLQRLADVLQEYHDLHVSG